MSDLTPAETLRKAASPEGGGWVRVPRGRARYRFMPDDITVAQLLPPERVAMTPVPEAPAITAVPEPPPAAPVRSADCGRCGYRRNMLGHVWACVAPGGRWRS